MADADVAAAMGGGDAAGIDVPAELQAMIIRGIRSFGHENPQTIRFMRPLTVIVGDNGTGKTTIIECLRYAATGTLPPGSSSGQSFVHDPRYAGLPEVKAQIKLKFVGHTGTSMVCVRDLQTTVTAKKMTYKALDSVLLTYGADGKKTGTSHRCGDMDDLMPQLLGVPKPVLEHVVFCHQEESNWPLQEGAKLKEKFDAIFEAARYTKALDDIRKQKKERSQEWKEADAAVTLWGDRVGTFKRITARAEDTKAGIAKLKQEMEDLAQEEQQAKIVQDTAQAMLDATAAARSTMAKKQVQADALADSIKSGEREIAALKNEGERLEAQKCLRMKEDELLVYAAAAEDRVKAAQETVATKSGELSAARARYSAVQEALTNLSRTFAQREAAQRLAGELREEAARALRDAQAGHAGYVDRLTDSLPRPEQAAAARDALAYALRLASPAHYEQDESTFLASLVKAFASKTGGAGRGSSATSSALQQVVDDLRSFYDRFRAEGGNYINSTLSQPVADSRAAVAAAEKARAKAEQDAAVAARGVTAAEAEVERVTADGKGLIERMLSLATNAADFCGRRHPVVSRAVDSVLAECKELVAAVEEKAQALITADENAHLQRASKKQQQAKLEQAIRDRSETLARARAKERQEANTLTTRAHAQMLATQLEAAETALLDALRHEITGPTPSQAEHDAGLRAGLPLPPLQLHAGGAGAGIGDGAGGGLITTDVPRALLLVVCRVPEMVSAATSAGLKTRDALYKPDVIPTLVALADKFSSSVLPRLQTAQQGATSSKESEMSAAERRYDQINRSFEAAKAARNHVYARLTALPRVELAGKRLVNLYLASEAPTVESEAVSDLWAEHEGASAAPTLPTLPPTQEGGGAGGHDIDSSAIVTKEHAEALLKQLSNALSDYRDLHTSDQAKEGVLTKLADHIVAKHACAVCGTSFKDAAARVRAERTAREAAKAASGAVDVTVRQRLTLAAQLEAAYQAAIADVASFHAACTEVEATQQRVVEAEARVATAKAALRKEKDNSARLAKVKEGLEKVTNALAAIRTQHSARENTVRALKETREQLDRETGGNDEVAAPRVDVDALQRQVDLDKEQLEKLKREALAADQRAAEAQDAQRKAGDFRHALDDLIREQSQLASRRAAATSRREEERKAKASAEADARGASDEILRQNDLLAEANARLNAAQSAINNVADMHYKLLERLADLVKRMAKAEADIAVASKAAGGDGSAGAGAGRAASGGDDPAIQSAKLNGELKEIAARVAVLEKEIEEAQKKRDVALSAQTPIKEVIRIQGFKRERVSLLDEIGEIEGKIHDKEAEMLEKVGNAVGDMQFDTVEQVVGFSQNQLQKLGKSRASKDGQLKELHRTLEEIKKELSQPDLHLKEAPAHHSENLARRSVLKAVVADLEIYYKALDMALMKYHSMKITEINAILKELWMKTYHGDDIEYIQIQSDVDSGEGAAAAASGGRGSRNYNYRIVMYKSRDVSMEMRGRCSAGQKVLASILIRLALAETFCLKTGILALDEATTNLDYHNRKQLAASLAQLVRARAGTALQLILITHDEEFVTDIQRALRDGGGSTSRTGGDLGVCYRISREEVREGYFQSRITPDSSLLEPSS